MQPFNVWFWSWIPTFKYENKAQYGSSSWMSTTMDPSLCVTVRCSWQMCWKIPPLSRNVHVDVATTTFISNLNLYFYLKTHHVCRLPSPCSTVYFLIFHDSRLRCGETHSHLKYRHISISTWKSEARYWSWISFKIKMKINQVAIQVLGSG